MWIPSGWNLMANRQVLVRRTFESVACQCFHRPQPAGNYEQSPSSHRHHKVAVYCIVSSSSHSLRKSKASGTLFNPLAADEAVSLREGREMVRPRVIIDFSPSMLIEP